MSSLRAIRCLPRSSRGLQLSGAVAYSRIGCYRANGIGRVSVPNSKRDASTTSNASESSKSQTNPGVPPSTAKSSDMPWMLISGAVTLGVIGYLMRSPKADKEAHDIVQHHVRQEDYVMPTVAAQDKDGEKGKQDAPNEGRPEDKGVPNPEYGRDDIKESGKDDQKEPMERRGESFEKDNSNQANKGQGAGAPRDVESSSNKGGMKEKV